MVKILVLGNEFVEGDSFAKKVGDYLKKDLEIVKIKDSFELMGFLNSDEDFIILDVVQGLNEVKEIQISDLRTDSIMSAHDFDAGFVLKLSGREVRIIGIPIEGGVEGVGGVVREKIYNTKGCL